METAEVITVYSISIPGLKFNIPYGKSIEECKSIISSQLDTLTKDIDLYEDSILLKGDTVLEADRSNLLKLYAKHPISVLAQVDDGRSLTLSMRSSNSPADLLSLIPFSCSGERSLYSVYRGSNLLKEYSSINARHMETLEVKRNENLELVHFIYPPSISKGQKDYMPFVDEIVKENQSVLCLVLEKGQEELLGLFMRSMNMGGKKDLLELVPIAETKRIYEIRLKPNACLVSICDKALVYVVDLEQTMEQALPYLVNNSDIKESQSLTPILPDSILGDLINRFSTDRVSLSVKSKGYLVLACISMLVL